MKANILTLAIVVIGIVSYFALAPPTPWTPHRIVGAAIAVPSFLLLFLARIQLGSSFSIAAQAHKLVTRGLYSRIRNPIYVFGGLFIAGFLVFIGRPWLLILFVVLIPLQIYRARKEEKVLADKFGDEYARYKAQTWF